MLQKYCVTSRCSHEDDKEGAKTKMETIHNQEKMEMYKIKTSINIIIALLICLLPVTAFAKHIHHESWYQQKWADKYGGVVEYVLKDGKRVDILTSTHAIEVDFAPKFYEALGQSLLYAARTNKYPGIILIIEKQSDTRYVDNLKEIIYRWNLPMTIWTIRP